MFRAVAAMLLACALSACSSSAVPQVSVDASPAQVTVGTITLDGPGTVLASGGRALYVFSPDHKAAVTCTGVCAGTWPPLRITTGGQATGVPDLATVASPDGYDVITFHGWPLYRYAGDDDATHARGQALFLNGGPWYVIRADGTIVTAP